ncbi:MAG: hypothetical protein M3217_06150 [Actinomycetota bacterium]|nr:hypothetical protein [Actinomycetota bacterium]
MSRRIAFVLLAALLLPAAVVPAVQADGRGLVDGDDIREGLDIARVSHGHRASSDGARLLVHSIRLYRAWPVKRLQDQAFTVLNFDLRGRRGEDPERRVQILSEDGKLVARMFDMTAEPPAHLGRVGLRLPDRRTLRVVFPTRLLRRGLERYKWNAVTNVDGGSALCRRRVGCWDWAPDDRGKPTYIAHAV